MTPRITHGRITAIRGTVVDVEFEDALPEVEGFEFAWRYRPCEELAGDTLNCFRLDEGHIGVFGLAQWCWHANADGVHIA